MARGNQGFADLITGGEGRQPAARLPPRTGILDARENRLAALAAGNQVTRVHEFYDPARCRVWEGHNRDYAALNQDNCADLIESFRAQGRQEVPAIVRRVTGDAACDFEVICGARRHWTVTWLRAHDHPEFRFLIEPRELTDEEAFRLADLENRHRKDLSDYERATDYARAIERYYGGSQQRMVERLEVTKSWLSRYLELAKLPPEVIASFGSPHVIGISHAAALGPLLRAPKTRERVLANAIELAEVQSVRAARGEAAVPAAVVTRRLTTIADKRPKPANGEVVIRDDEGAVIARGEKGRGGLVTLALPNALARGRDEVLAAVGEILEQLADR